MEAASCSAVRTSLVGSMMPLEMRLPYLARLRVIAVGVGVLLQDRADHDRAVLAGFDGDLACGPGDCLADDLAAGLLVVVVGADFLRIALTDVVGKETIQAMILCRASPNTGTTPRGSR